MITTNDLVVTKDDIIRKENKLENKKFKLYGESLDLIHLIQHIVFININTYKNMSCKDFSNKSIRHSFDILCESYLKLHESFSISDCLYNSYNDTDDQTINKYIIKTKELTCCLIIDLKKEYNNCVRIGIQNFDMTSGIIPINIFNIQFEAGN